MHVNQPVTLLRTCTLRACMSRMEDNSGRASGIDSIGVLATLSLIGRSLIAEPVNGTAGSTIPVEERYYSPYTQYAG